MSANAVRIKTTSQYVTSRILENAMHIVRQAEVHPKEIKKRLISISTVLLIGLAGTIVAFVVISAGIPQSEQTRLLALLLLLGSIAVFLSSILGLVIVMWSAYAYRHVQALESQRDAEEATDLNCEILRATIEIGNDPEICREIIQAARDSQEIDTARFAARLSNIMRRYLDHVPGAAALIEEIQPKRNTTHSHS